MGRGKGKGGAFERDMARVFSEWWSYGKRDDIFWRTSASGARATVRMRKGKKTFGQHGDLQATDPSGGPLLRLLSIELKRGYKKADVSSALDRNPTANDGEWEQFVKQARHDSKAAGLPYWLLVIRRDGRQPMIFIPWALYEHLEEELDCLRPWACVRALTGPRVFGTTLDEFLEAVSPKVIKRLESTINGTL